MKLVYSLTLSFLLFVFITNLSIAFSNDDNEEIHDITGAPVIEGNEYFIAASIGGPDHSGGLGIAGTSNSNFTLTLIQTNISYRFGTSVKFTNLKYFSERILTSTPLDIVVTAKSSCTFSSEWLVSVDYTIKKAFLGVGSYDNYEYSQILTGTFSILKHGSFSYKFRFFSDESNTYSDIGIYDDNEEVIVGIKRLYLAGEDVKDPFEFVIIPDYFFVNGIIKSVV